MADWYNPVSWFSDSNAGSGTATTDPTTTTLGDIDQWDYYGNPIDTNSNYIGNGVSLSTPSAEAESVGKLSELNSIGGEVTTQKPPIANQGQGGFGGWLGDIFGSANGILKQGVSKGLSKALDLDIGGKEPTTVRTFIEREVSKSDLYIDEKKGAYTTLYLVGGGIALLVIVVGGVLVAKK